MGSDSFNFKQFTLRQSRSAMKIGTDGVLLGAWAELPPGKDTTTIADIGTGTGLIALMMAQRYANARIMALEIDPQAAAEAKDNISHSPWSDRVQILNDDFAHWQPQIKFDLIVSNPPFFTEDLKSPDLRRATARHAAALSPVTLIDRAAHLLTPDGVLAFISAASQPDIDAIIWQATLSRLCCTRKCMVISRSGKNPSRVLWQFTLGSASCIESTLELRDATNAYTSKYQSLVNDFYLWMH